MTTIRLPPDFKEFLKLLNSAKIEYLLVGGLNQFGFHQDSLSAEIFLKERNVVRMGVPPVRIDLLTTVSGVDFVECYTNREQGMLDGVEVSLISLENLKQNKLASGRAKDLGDLKYLASLPRSDGQTGETT